MLKENKTTEVIAGAQVYDGDEISRFLAELGAVAAHMTRVAAVNAVEFAVLFAQYLWDRTILLRDRVSELLIRAGAVVLSPFVRIFDYIAEVLAAASEVRRLRKPRGELITIGTGAAAAADTERAEGFEAAKAHLCGIIIGGEERPVRVTRRGVVRSVKMSEGLLPSLVNLTVPVLALVFLVQLVLVTTGASYGVKLSVNNIPVGFIENEQVYGDAQAIVMRRLNTFGGGGGNSGGVNVVMPDFYPQFEVGAADPNGQMLSKYQVADLLIQQSGLKVEQAYGFYIDDSFYGAVTDNALIRSTLANMLSEYKLQAQNIYGGEAEVNFVNTIDYERAGYYLSDSIVDPETIIRGITGLRQEENHYTVVEGDSPSVISDKLGLTTEEIAELNPGWPYSDLKPGDEIRISVEKPMLPVSVTITSVQRTYTPYETVYEDDASMYVGTENTYQTGEQGLDSVTYELTYVDGRETGRRIVDTEHVSDPVKEIIYRGTKEYPHGAPSSSAANKGTFMRPIPYGVGYISTYFNLYSHRGIDIACARGTPIYAAGAGTVIVSGSYYADYGKCIIIQHPNGLQTLYAHCSALHVSAGQRVNEGDFIGEVGMTGRATGNHVHFEVISGSAKLDPLNYIS